MLGRILVAVVGVPLLIAVLLFCPPVCLPVALGALCGIAVYELLYITGVVKNKRVVLYAILFSTLVPFWYYFGCQMIWAVAALFLFMLLLFGEAIASKQQMKVEEIALSVFGAVLISMMLSIFVLIADVDHAKFYLLLPFVAAFSSDAFALFAGMALGKHKLAPTLSPKKTIEGSIGGFFGAAICCVLYGVVVQVAFGHYPTYPVLILYGLLGSFVSQIGDLSFSYIKRQYGLKDYGHLFREHGGVLDRFDSVIFCAPLTYLLVTIIPFFQYNV